MQDLPDRATAALWAILILIPFLEQQRSIVCTDHDTRNLILNLPYATEILAKERLCSSKIEFAVVHREGIKTKSRPRYHELKRI